MALSLNERAQRARKVLFDRYDQINALWLKAEEQIVQFHIPRPVCYGYHTECEFTPCGEQPVVEHCLGVQKVKGKWRICYGTYPYNWPADPDWKPITECSAEVRTAAAKHLPNLRQAVVECAEKFIAVADDAIEELEQFVKQDISHLLAERAKLNGSER
ncbi:MAG: hypothetical protein HY000_36810 [Planctomycetes bacterium]|nr:hypothetical protein [Planctomycetota bacterium]